MNCERSEAGGGGGERGGESEEERGEKKLPSIRNKGRFTVIHFMNIKRTEKKKNTKNDLRLLRQT